LFELPAKWLAQALKIEVEKVRIAADPAAGPDRRIDAFPPHGPEKIWNVQALLFA